MAENLDGWSTIRIATFDRNLIHAAADASGVSASELIRSAAVAEAERRLGLSSDSDRDDEEVAVHA